MSCSSVRQLSNQVGERVPQLLLLLELVRVRAGPAGILDFLLPRHDLAKRARNGAAGAPQVDLEGQRVLALGAFEHPLQRRVGDQPAVPIMFALDLDRGESRAARRRSP